MDNLSIDLKKVLPFVIEAFTFVYGEKYRDIAKAMGVEGTENMSQEEYRKAAVDAVRKLSQDVGIPADLKEIVKKEDIPFLAQSAYDSGKSERNKCRRYYKII